MPPESTPSWEQYKADHPVGSEITGTVTHVAPFGVYVDLGVPFYALLLVPYIAPQGSRKQFPEDYPKVGERITAFIRHFGDEGKIALTQSSGPPAIGILAQHDTPVLEYAPPSHTRAHSPFPMLAITIGMSFTFAVTYVVVMTLTLPPSDMAYGQMPFAHPLALPATCMGAVLAGVVVFPFYYVALRRRPLLKGTAIVTGLVLTEIATVTPVDAGMGFVGSFAAFFVGLACARVVLREHRVGTPTRYGHAQSPQQ